MQSIFNRSLIAAGLILLCGTATLTAEPADVGAQGVKKLQQLTPEMLQKDIEQQHPAAYYVLASKLFAAKKQDEAVFWFYLGQIRYRAHLAANPALEPSGDPALFSSLSETVGRPLNEYAFGSIPTLAQTIDKALAWDEAHANGFTPKDKHAKAYEGTRAGLVKLREMIVKQEASIKRQRAANGLENR